MSSAVFSARLICLTCTVLKQDECFTEEKWTVFLNTAGCYRADVREAPEDDHLIFSARQTEMHTDIETFGNQTEINKAKCGQFPETNKRVIWSVTALSDWTTSDANCVSFCYTWRNFWKNRSHNRQMTWLWNKPWSRWSGSEEEKRGQCTSAAFTNNGCQMFSRRSVMFCWGSCQRTDITPVMERHCMND